MSTRDFANMPKAKGYLRGLASHFNAYLAFCTIILGVSSCNQAFETNSIGTTQAMPYFIKQFGDCNAAGKCMLPTSYLSVLNAVPNAAQALGVVVAGLLMNRIGRRMSNFLMCLWAIMGAVVMVTARSRGQLMAARVLNYVYYGCGLVVNSAYSAELVPGPVRGIAVGAYYVSFTLAALIMSGVQVGTAKIASNASWEIPFGLWLPMPIICCIATFWLVESPRYLLMKGREEEARAVLIRCRVNKADEAIDSEINDIKLALQADGNQGRWKDIIKGTNWRRTWILLGLAPLQSATGSSFTSSYGAIYIATIHSISAYNFNLIGSIIGFFGCVLVMVYLDKVGRRPLIIGSCAIQSCLLLAMASTGLQKPVVSQAGTNFIVACILLFNTSFHTGCIPVIHAVIAELPEQTLRAKMQLVAQFTNVAVGVGISYATPYLFRADAANLGPKVGFIFLPIDIFGALFTYFCMPEIKGRSLEEVDLLFLSKIGARESVHWTPESTTAGLLNLVPDSKTLENVEMDDVDQKKDIGGDAQHVEQQRSATEMV